MIAIQGKLVSRDVTDKEFVCNLGACKGMCCVLGDEGATITQEEADKMEEIYEVVKPYLTENGVEIIEEAGIYTTNDKGVMSTQLVEGKECAFISYDEKGVALCGIERAHRDGKVDFKKPVSCHLYPIRVTEYQNYDAVNYEKWEICSPACKLGAELKVPVYKFLKEPLIRKYGEDFYNELEAAAQHIEENGIKDE